MCSSLKFISEAGHLNFLFFVFLTYFYLVCNSLSLFRDFEIFSVTVALHLRWLTTEKFQNYEKVKNGRIPSKDKFKTQKKTKVTVARF